MNESRKGEFFILGESVLWAFFPIVTALSYASLSGLVSLSWSTLFSAIFFAALVLYRQRWAEMRRFQLWKYVSGVVLFIGVLFYVLYFLGLEYTTPGNAAVIATFEIFTSFVFFHILRSEPMTCEHKVGAVLMLFGAVIILGKDFSGFNGGDVLILLATMCAPIGNLFQQKARQIASAETIMFIRSLLATPILFLLADAFAQDTSFSDVKIALPFLVINGFLLLGLSKIFWIEAIHRISVTKANALNILTPLLTLLFAWVILEQQPSMWQLSSLGPLLLGILLLTDQIRLRSR